MTVGLIVVVVIVMLVVACKAIYHGIVKKDNRCDNAWQTIDTQLQRRNDLVPNLVESVKGYATHESDTLADVTNARSAISDARTPEAKMAASNELSSALGSLFVSVEAYPELKASANFQQLQTELADTENKIGYARMSYNDCVLDYNNAITTFPGSVVAGSRFRRRRGFECMSNDARVAPKVSF